MADIDLKTLTPDTSLPTDGFLFGADSQSAASPSVFTTQSVATTLLGSTSLSGATVTTSQPVLNLSQTWNAGGVTFTGLKFNATDTASAAASLLLDLQVGGTSKFQVTKAGNIVVPTNSFLGITNGSASGGFFFNASSIVTTTYFAATFLNIPTNSGTITFGASNDIILSRAAAASLQLGAADAAAPVAQTLQVQSVVAGTTNTAGTNFTIKGSAGTGTGAGGSIIFQVAPAGTTGTSQNALATALTVASDKTVTAATTLYANTFANSGGQGITATTAQLGLFSTGLFGWTNNAGSAGALDTILARDAANTLALRNGTNAQTFNVYNTYTDASNYERGFVSWASNVLKIGTEKAGTGSARNTGFYYDGALKAGVINDGLSTGRLRMGGTILGTHNVILDAGTNGILLLWNGTANDFDRLQFGGTTSSFPALKRSSASLICRLADDSANAAFEALSLKTAAPTGGTSGTWKVGVYNATAPSATGYVEVDIGGTLYKLLAAT